MKPKLSASSVCSAGIVLGLALVQASCSPTAPRAAELPTTVPSPGSQPVLVTTPSRAAMPLLLVDGDTSGTRLRVRPVDPVTLADVPGTQPISLENNYTAALSSDGRTFAAITWPKNQMANRGGALHVIDLARWADQTTAVTFEDYVRQLLFDADGRRLYWVRPGPMTAEPALNADPGVYRYDLVSATLSRVVPLPANFLPEFAGVGIAGDRMAIVGSTIGEPSSSRAAEVYVVDLAKGELVVRFELAGIRAGQVRQPGAGIDDLRNVRPALGWDLPRGRLYVVDADDDRVAVIDLAAAAVRGPVAIRPRLSLLDRLLALLSPPAEAKMQSSSDRRAVVSPDGRRLYLSGFRSDFVGSLSAQDPGREQVTPLPLQVIETTNMSEIGRMDIASTELAISPDGRHLLAVTNRVDAKPTGWATRSGYQLRLIDPERLTVVASMALEDRGRVLGFAGDGEVAYVSAYDTSDSVVLRRVGLADLQLQQVRKTEHGVGDIFIRIAH